jgi:hypothetical protein
MVIIGSDPSQLDALKATLLGMLASPEPIHALRAKPSAQRAMVPAAEELKELVDGHERFEVVHALCFDGKTYWQQKTESVNGQRGYVPAGNHPPTLPLCLSLMLFSIPTICFPTTFR